METYVETDGVLSTPFFFFNLMISRSPAALFFRKEKGKKKLEQSIAICYDFHLTTNP